MGTVEAIDDEVLSILETLSKNNCLFGIYTNKYLKEKLNVYYLRPLVPLGRCASTLVPSFPVASNRPVAILTCDPP